LHNAQLNIGAAWRWTTWDPAGPKTIALSTLYLYKMWRDHLVEMKAGYITNDTEFVGMQVGGSLATGAQGVYAVLPYQVGMSYFPLTAPSLNIRLRAPRAPTSRSAHSGASTLREARPRWLAIGPDSGSFRKVTDFSSSMRLATSARRAPLLTRPGFVPATCTTVPSTRTRSRPAITPRVADTLTFTATWGLYL